ncbi:substrate-binding domain-containing protein [Microbacterium immunditiarum]|uniref:LacI family transcriptional regulator n=1 Tax=Microbacterium immunditiarum TaxID=337480 RepID=A0A7Y9KJE7_9MICO|nr:LacI family transcriptional regulator [Microbacterium immunditiarum]
MAEAAGVSPSTVSRALRVPGRLNATTEARIRKVAEELGYQLNPMAQALQTGRSSTIALIVSDLGNPVYFDIVRGAQREARLHGYTVIFAESEESGAHEAEAAARLIPSVDALVLVASRLTNRQIAELAKRKRVVLINRRVPDVAAAVPDLQRGVEEALSALKALGHQSLVYLSGPSRSWMSRERRRVITTASQQLGLVVEVLGPFPPTLAGGHQAARAIPGEATAVIAFNDLMAIGVIRRLQALGVAVPEQLSIVGFDDIFGADLIAPALATVRTPLDMLGARAIRMALDAAAAEERPASATFIQRDSIGPAA